MSKYTYKKEEHTSGLLKKKELTRYSVFYPDGALVGSYNNEKDAKRAVDQLNTFGTNWF